MENVNFQPSGEEIERALMDLGPLLGVTIKEEVQDELGEASSAPASRVNVGSASESGKGSGGGDGGGGADSLASPGAARSPAGARCVLCQAPLALADGTPKLMECLHSACEPCINAKLEERQANSRDFLGAERITVTCPACRLQCQVANMIDQRFVLEKMAAEQAGSSSAGVGEQQCNSCEDTEPATSYCVDCAEFICDNCVHAHQRLKITKDHTIKSKEEALAELQAAQATPSANDMFCRDHVQERLTLFCETCDRLTCRDCQLQHHRDHKYQFSTEMAAQARANISSLLSEVSYKRVLLGSAMKVIRDRQQLIADKKKALVHDITQTVVKLTNAINTRGKQLVLRLNEVCDAKQRTLAEKKDALEQLAAITDHCVDFVTRALDQGSDTAVLYSKRAVCSHLQRIKSRRADIPNPEIPVRISLALDKLPDLIRVLSSIGAIVVDGKVDGAGGAQGPYHPPAQPPPAPPAHPAPPAPPAPPHSAVVALQQVAMHQSYVQSVPGGGGYLLQTRHARPPTPLRHPHVTSTTHPHHLHGMNEMNLRGLLSAQAQRGAAPARAPLPSAHPAAHPSAHAAMQHAYQQMMGAYASNAYNVVSASYVQSVPGGGGYLLQTRHARPPTPLRHPHVTSTTHPHHLHGMNEMNLRGLLSAQAQRGAAPARAPLPSAHPAAHPSAHAAMQHAYQQMMGAYASNAYNVVSAVNALPAPAPAPPAGSGRRSGGPRTPSPAPNYPHQPAKWHIPQQNAPNGGVDAGALGGGACGGPEYKITLGRPRAPAAPAAVTSTNPKTPSPSLNGVGGALELDKVCAESVQDLMATIAKLDSNGVQVVAERPERAPPAASAPSPAPHVHSSTDVDATAKAVAESLGVGGGAAGAADPNEDWCAVCMDGGELMCCDKCPKVFHQYCHIPTIEKLPDETESWQCLLCVNFADSAGEDEGWCGPGLSPRQQRLVERITLELYCQYEASLPFREPVPADNLHYHSKIARPMCLDAIRMQLQPRAPQRYTHVAQFVHDCRLLFRNAYHYNPPDSALFKDAKRLEEFFDAQLVKFLPEYAYWSGDGEPPQKRARAHALAC
ncbi:transcription intermediary factor 1-alpha [Ostrinia furnacalis]|uniref:transcription intermediary factor 1-alpha n=1 Tax=Ostrinia furnacalis TaxID=93504 RepID=UPI00103CF525|nr:transcription intermediary factor 1-alpha [Ostrinia furnacalis]